MHAHGPLIVRHHEGLLTTRARQLAPARCFVLSCLAGRGVLELGRCACALQSACHSNRMQGHTAGMLSCSVSVLLTTAKWCGNTLHEEQAQHKAHFLKCHASRPWARPTPRQRA